MRNVLENTPDLQDHPPRLWKNTFQIFQDQGFEVKKIISAIVAHPKLLYCKETQINNALTLWRKCDFGESQLHTMIENAPQLIEASEYNILNGIPRLESIIGNKKRVSMLLMRSPNAILENWDNIEQKLNYLLNEMKIGISEIVKSSALRRTLFEIKCRHLFLERLGIFEVRKLKNNKAEISRSNPHLSLISDTTDHIFAKEIAKTSYEEFIVFKNMCDKEFEEFDKEEEEFNVDSN